MHNFIAQVFNDTFSLEYKTHLIGGYREPFYRASKGAEAAVICYREDYASSALHEVAHWCIAGPERLRQDDFGYWYEPDGRDERAQRAFELVEVKPQALEWLFSIAAGVSFCVSVDNLASDKKVSNEFSKRIQGQALHYLQFGVSKRAAMFIQALAKASDRPMPGPEHLSLPEIDE